MNKYKIISAISFCFFAGIAHAQSTDPYIHEADPNNLFGNASYFKKDGFDGNPNKNFIVRCISSCTTQYGVWYDTSMGLWAIVANDRNQISKGARFEISDRAVLKKRPEYGALTFEIDLSDMKNHCPPFIGISITPNFQNNDESLRDLEFPMVISKQIYDAINTKATVSFVIDMPLTNNYDFNIAIDKARDECYTQGVAPENFRAFTATMTMSSLAERIIDDVSLTVKFKTYGKDLPNQLDPSVVKSNGLQIKPPQEIVIPPAKFPKTKIPKQN